jgi:hypothetical protein
MERFHGRALNVKVFLEGIEVDVVSVSVRGGFNSGASAVIQVPFSAAALRFYPRTLVHIFYVESAATVGTDGVRVNKADLTDWRNWRLLFAGEVLAFQHVDVGSNKQIVLSCQDFSTYWQHAKLYWGTNNVSHYSYKTNVAAGGLRLYSGTKRVDGTDALLNLLKAKPATIPRLTGVLGGLVALLEASTGVFHPMAKDRFRGVNDFMSQAELRLKLTHMIGAAADDTTSSKFIDSAMFTQYFRRLGRSIGQTASFMDLVNLFLGRIYYSWVSVPAPPYFPENVEKKDTTVKVAKERTVKGKRDPKIRDDLDIVGKLLTAVRGLRREETQRRLRGDITEDQGDGIKYSVWKGAGQGDARTEDKLAKTAFSSTTAAFQKMVTRWESENSEVAALKRELDQQGGGAYEKYINTVQVAHIRGIEAKKLIETMLGDGYNSPNMRDLQSLLEGIAALLKKWLGGGTVTTFEDADIALGDRLHAHLFVPDLYMAPPPTCNVLFPDHYTQLQFSRNWMSEITRLLLHTKTQSGMDVKDLYFSPNTDIWGGPKIKDVEEAIKKGASFLMEHEKYTGVLAAIEGIGDSAIFKKIHEDVKKAAGEQPKIDPKAKGPAKATVSGEALLSPMEHLRRAANYLFFSRRFEGRSMSVVARFSPQVVVGLPMLVLTKTAADAVPDPDSGKKGTHFLGLVAGLSHDIDSQGNAITRIELTKCRDHREGLDIFGTGYGEATKTKTVKKIIKVNKKKDVKLLTAPDAVAGYSLTGENLKPPTVSYTGASSKNQLWLYNLTAEDAITAAGFVPDPTISYNVVVKELPEDKQFALPTNPKAAASAIKAREAQGYADPQVAGTDESPRVEITVTELVARGTRASTRSQDITFSFENSATPPWLAQIYLPINIGKAFYQKMLGCGSIFDVSPLTSYANVQATPADTNNVYLNLSGASPQSQIAIPNYLLAPANTIEQAADNLSETWERLRSIGADIPYFIELYGNRSYASMPQIMGYENPHLAFVSDSDISRARPTAVQEGFHENAYGNLTDMKDVKGRPLQFDPLPTRSGTSASGSAPAKTPGAVETVDARVDPRQARYDRVRAHATALAATKTGFRAKE